VGERYAPNVCATPQMVERDPRRWSTLDDVETISRDLQRRLAVALSESGHRRLRPSFGPLLERLRDGALPVGQVATALDVSPQAASRAALVLEQFGYVARTASAVDGRSRVVALTSRGDDLMARAAETFVMCEHAYEDILGSASISRVRRDLEELRIRLEAEVKRDLAVPVPSTRSIGSVILIALWAKGEIAMRVSHAGHQHVRRSHVELLSAIRSEGVRMSDIARELGVTRQAISATVQELEGFGYVERRTDRTDGRAVLIAPSFRGLQLLELVAAAALEFETRGRAVLGNTRWTRFAREMSQLAAAVANEPDTLSPPAHVRVLRSDRATDLASLAEDLRSRLGPRQAARLAVLLTTGKPAAPTSRSHSRTAKLGNR
jgi:DNA-binding MarR family transcriptional regulator